MLSNTPLAASPYEAMKCLNKYTNLQVRWISIKNGYGDGRDFPSDLIFDTNREECMKVLQESDIIHLHNDIFRDKEVMEIVKRKKTIIQMHSIPIRPSMKEIRVLGKKLYTISQPLQESLYNLPSLPNLIDPEEYTPMEKNNERIKIIFAPTNSWPIKRDGSKGQVEVVSILNNFKNRAEVEVFSNLNYEDNLARKRQGDILIDDVARDTFHRTTLEGCCFGLAVLSGGEGGWLRTGLHNLASNLNKLLDDEKYLISCKKKCRDWVVNCWNPKILCKKYIEAYNSI